MGRITKVRNKKCFRLKLFLMCKVNYTENKLVVPFILCKLIKVPGAVIGRPGDPGNILLLHQRTDQLRISGGVFQWESGDKKGLIIEKLGIGPGPLLVPLQSGAEGGKGAGVGVDVYKRQYW